MFKRWLDPPTRWKNACEQKLQFWALQGRFLTPHEIGGKFDHIPTKFQETSTLCWRTGWAPAWHHHTRPGNLTKNYGKIHHFSWENPLFRLGHFSIANCKRLPEGRYQQIINKSTTDQQGCSFFVQLVYSSLLGLLPQPKVFIKFIRGQFLGVAWEWPVGPTGCTNTMWWGKNPVPLCILLKPIMSIQYLGLVLVDFCRSFLVELIGREGFKDVQSRPRNRLTTTTTWPNKSKKIDSWSTAAIGNVCVCRVYVLICICNHYSNSCSPYHCVVRPVHFLGPRILWFMFKPHPQYQVESANLHHSRPCNSVQMISDSFINHQKPITHRIHVCYIC